MTTLLPSLPGGRRAWDGPLTLGALFVLFFAVHNPYWVPTGDGEVFLTAARNLHHGQGLTYLGEPLRVAAPGWPVTLAGLLWLGDGRIAAMKLAQVAFMTVGLMGWFAALSRGRTRIVAAGSVVLAAICSPVYPLTFWPHSDAILVAFAGLSVWSAATFRTTGRQRWLVATCGLIATGVLMRWAGLAFAIIPAMVCVGTRRNGTRAAGIVAGLTVLASAVVAFGFVQAVVRGYGPITLAAADAATAPELFVRERPDLSIIGEFWHRAQRLHNWVGWALFAPMRFLGFGGMGRAGEVVNATVGLLTVGLLVVAAVSEGRRGRWLFAGVTMYVLGLALSWPFPNPRYLVPALPGLIAGVLLALVRIGWISRLHLVAKSLRWLFVSALLVVNGTMWAVDVWIARSPTPIDFYTRYEAGLHLNLMAAADELSGTDGLIATSERYENLHERWSYQHASRVVAYLADRPSIPVPNQFTGWGVKKLQQWGRDNDVAWYIHQNPTVPGRIWHFRLTHHEHGLVMGDEPGPREWQFELYRMQNFADPGEPPRRWLTPHVTPPLVDDRLDEVARRVPFWNQTEATHDE